MQDNLRCFGAAVDYQMARAASANLGAKIRMMRSRDGNDQRAPPMMLTKEARMTKHKTPTLEGSQETTEPTTELEELIRFRAYELYEQRGGQHGHDLEDWLQAELELTSKKPVKVAA